MARVAIHTEDLTRDFGALRAVDRVSIDAPEGTVFGLLGPQGAGKTTVIRMLLGLLEPTAGNAEVLGFDTRTQGEEIRLRTGVVLEDDGLYERLSAEDNLDYFARIWRLSANQRKTRSAELMAHFSLWERRHEVVGAWDRNMKRKLSIARAFIHRPLLVFMDEPTIGLGRATAAVLRGDIRRLVAQERITVFLTTQNPTDVDQLCAQVAVIHCGSLLVQCPASELDIRAGAPLLEISGRGFGDDVLALVRRRPEVASARRQNGRLLLELKGNVDTAPLISLLVESSADIEEVHKSRAGLEKVLLELMEADKAVT